MGSGLSAQPGHGGAIHGLGQQRRFHAEAGGKHLGQHNQVGGAGEAGQGQLKRRAVGGGIVPVQIGLDEGNGEVGHNGREEGWLQKAPCLAGVGGAAATC